MVERQSLKVPRHQRGRRRDLTDRKTYSMVHIRKTPWPKVEAPITVTILVKSKMNFWIFENRLQPEDVFQFII